VSLRHITLLVFLAAIWGGAFSLIRNAVPALGPLGLSAVRLAVAAVVMAGYLRATGGRLHWHRHRRAFLVVGTFGAALPFPLFAYGATQWPAGSLAIVNATVPLWGALLARVWLGDRISPLSFFGLASGFGGVVLLTGTGPVAFTPSAALALAAALAASLCFAVSGVAAKALGRDTPAAVLGTGVLLVGTAVNVPLTMLSPPPGVTLFALANAVLLGLFASALATVLYLRLIKEIGPTRSMTVTFLIPVWGIFWSAVLLGEPVNAAMLGACALVLVGTALVIVGQRPVPPALPRP
jgi:drug/metabolite transporter (DMT)-like permease